MRPGTCGLLVLRKVVPPILLGSENSGGGGGHLLWVSFPPTHCPRDSPLEGKPLDKAGAKVREVSRFSHGEGGVIWQE